jgi:hypothetical protein
MYKNFMITHREILKAEILNDEKNNVSTINYVHTELTNSKQEMLNIVKKMQDSWKAKTTKGTARYFG